MRVRILTGGIAAVLCSIGLILTPGAARADEAVICADRHPETGLPDGGLKGRPEGCLDGELEVGRAVDASEGIYEFFGGEVEFPEGSYDPEPSFVEDEAAEEAAP